MTSPVQTLALIAGMLAALEPRRPVVVIEDEPPKPPPPNPLDTIIVPAVSGPRRNGHKRRPAIVSCSCGAELDLSRFRGLSPKAFRLATGWARVRGDWTCAKCLGAGVAAAGSASGGGR